jgi:hypothetical protein
MRLTGKINSTYHETRLKSCEAWLRIFCTYLLSLSCPSSWSAALSLQGEFFSNKYSEIGRNKIFYKKTYNITCYEKYKTIFNTKFSKHTLDIYAIRTKNKHLILIFTVFRLYFQNWFNYFTCIFWSI